MWVEMLCITIGIYNQSPTLSRQGYLRAVWAKMSRLPPRFSAPCRQCTSCQKKNEFIKDENCVAKMQKSCEKAIIYSLGAM